LVKIYGKDSHQIIKDLIKTEWENLINDRTNLPYVKKQKPDEFTVKIKGNNVREPFSYPSFELDKLDTAQKE